MRPDSRAVAVLQVDVGRMLEAARRRPDSALSSQELRDLLVEHRVDVPPGLDLADALRGVLRHDKVCARARGSPASGDSVQSGVPRPRTAARPARVGTFGGITMEMSPGPKSMGDQLP